MNLHEYQSKHLLKQYCVSVPEGIVADSANAAVDAAKKIKEKTNIDVWAVKAQVHAGGRGKAGGIKIAKSLTEVNLFSHEILGMRLITHQNRKRRQNRQKSLD